MAGSSASSGFPGWKSEISPTSSGPTFATARPVESSAPMFPSSPWCREITTSGVHLLGVMPSRRNSRGRRRGFRSVSAM